MALNPEEALAALGDLLEERDKRYSFLVVGGSSLLLLGLISRATADVDVVGTATATGYAPLDQLPDAVVEASREVARAFGLQPNWINVGPAGLARWELPPGLASRVQVRRFGGLELHLPDRVDLICFKLYAAVDQTERSQHYQDLQALAPTDE